jgi:hypothetical protein
MRPWRRTGDDGCPETGDRKRASKINGVRL